MVQPSKKKMVWFVGIPHEPWQLQPNWGTLKTPPIKKKGKRKPQSPFSA